MPDVASMPRLSTRRLPVVRSLLRSMARTLLLPLVLLTALPAGLTPPPTHARTVAESPARHEAPRRARADRLVILASIDALPAHLLGTGTLPALDAIAREGVRAAWMNPAFPTLTFPNHYTLVTGLRPDRHGIVNNNMIDPTLGVFYSKGDSARDGRWWGGEPIWATLQKQGGVAATMFWPGSEAEIAGERPRLTRAYDKTVSAQARVDQLLAWIDLPQAQRPQLMTVYFEQYDVAAHDAGAASVAAVEALRGIDAALASLRAGLRERGLDRRVDLVVVSDHGIADTPRENIRFLDDVLPSEAYTELWWGPLVGLRPAPGREREVVRAFSGRHDHFRCWTRERLPARWRYGRNRRVPPIVCQSDSGWRVQTRARQRHDTPVRGEHGYAPEDPAMRAMFVATGPSFRPRTTLPAFDNVDIYPLLAHLLDIRPAPNDGRLAPLRRALAAP